MKLLTNLVSIGCLLLAPAVSHAYIGPGAGLGALGTAIAVVFALLLLLVGFVWYPIKRLLRTRRTKQAEQEPENG